MASAGTTDEQRAEVFMRGCAAMNTRQKATMNGLARLAITLIASVEKAVDKRLDPRALGVQAAKDYFTNANRL